MSDLACTLADIPAAPTDALAEAAPGEELPTPSGVHSHRRTTEPVGLTSDGRRFKRVVGVVRLVAPWRDMSDDAIATVLRSTVVPDEPGYCRSVSNFDPSKDGLVVDYSATFMEERPARSNGIDITF